MKQKIGILGYGEIGQSLGMFYEDPMIKTLSQNTLKNGLDVLHVCIPYSEYFVDNVFQVLKKYSAELIIIHSTVKVGTTQKIAEKYPQTVHSPVRGVHPNLYNGMKTFVKFIGCDNLKVGKRVAEHFEDIGIKGEIVANSKTTELGKLLSTTYYGVCIAYHNYADKLCIQHNLDFEKVMTRFNETYNEGYTKLGKKNVVRPVLTPSNGAIGGHCIVNNKNILKEQFGDDPLLQNIV